MDQIGRLCSSKSINALHLYCRREDTLTAVWTKLKALFDANKKELVIHLGDFHDRYLLAGSDMWQGACEFKEKWHGLTGWKGVVFGASLNGVEKRPTYLLPFEFEDIRVIRRYLDEQSTVMTLEEITNAKAAQSAQRIATPPQSVEGTA